MKGIITRVAVCSVLLFPAEAAGQVQVRRISATDVCENCITRQLVRTITDRDRPGSLLAYAAVSSTRDGRFFIWSANQTEELHLADRNGNIVRQVGRTGDGPSEFRRPWFVLDLDDYFTVYDAQGRITYLDKQQLRSVRTVPLHATVMTPPVAMPGNRFVFTSYTLGKNPVEVNQPLHLVGPDGQVVRSFGRGVDLPHAPGHSPNPNSRVIAAGPDGTVWSARHYYYYIEQWDTSGTLLSVLQRDLPAMRNSPRDTSETPYISRIHDTGDGRLWVEILTLRPTAPDPNRFRRVSHARSETYVEVIDLESLRVIANGRITGWVPAQATGGYFISTYDVMEEEPVLRVWTYQIRR